MKKVGIILFCVFIVATFSYYNYDTTDFSGEWDFEGTDTDFSLTIIQNGTAISGTHCSVLYGGKKIDCSIDESDPPSVTGTASDDDSVIVIFKSTVADKVGQATIKRISATQITWNITQEPEGEYFIPKSATLTKK